MNVLKTSTFFILLSWFILPIHTYAAIIVVDVDGDSQQLEGDCSLRDAILSASINLAVDGCNAGEAGVQDAIVIQVPGPIQLTGEIPVFDSVSIATNPGAPMVTVIAGQGERIFRVNAPDNVTMNFAVANLRFIGGDAGDQAGGAMSFVRNGGGFERIEFNTTVFENNQARGGGAISFFETNARVLIVADSHFINNSSTGAGGAISSDAALTRSGPDRRFEINNSSFTNNHADTRGGAFLIVNDGPFSARIDMNDFIGNSATAGGGALSLAGFGLEASALFFLSKNLLLKNQAEIGGAIEVFAGGRGFIEGSVFALNEAFDRGGAVYAFRGASQVNTYLSMDYNTIVYNKAPQGDNIAITGTEFTGDRNIIAYPINGQNCWGVSSPLSPNLSTGNLIDSATCNLLADKQSTTIADPLLSGFTDDPNYFPGFQPTVNSPALDSGGVVPQTTDINGNLRPIDGDGDGSAFSDLGALEAPEGTDLIWRDNFGHDFGGGQ